MKTRRIRQKDIAEVVNVDISTVSLALNDDPRINPDTRRQVKKVAAELGYRPSVMAKAIRGVPTRSIAAIPFKIAHEHNINAIEGIQEAAENDSYATIIQSSQYSTEKEREVIFNLIDRAVDGLIIEAYSNSIGFYKEIYNQKIPVVFMILPCNEPWAVSVVVDDVHGSGLAVKHLYQKGHRKIAMINASPDTHFLNRHERICRKQGFFSAIEEVGIKPVSCEAKHYEIPEGYTAANHLLQKHNDITAIYCTSEALAVGASRAIYDMGLSIPDDISLIGFEGGMRGESMHPPLTSICGNLKKVGTTAAELLIKMLSEPGSVEPGIRVIPARILERKSVKDINP